MPLAGAKGVGDFLVVWRGMFRMFERDTEGKMQMHGQHGNAQESKLGPLNDN